MSKHIDIEKLLFDYTYTETLNQEHSKDDRVRKVLNEQPDTDVVPVVHAHWIFPYGDSKDYGDVLMQCSHCHTAVLKHFSDSHKYCPGCGAKMDEETEDE